MPDPSTTVGLGVAAYVGKDTIQKILGPTAEYLGAGLKHLVQKRAENIGRIFQRAEAFLGEGQEKPGIVHPKVAKAIIDEGSYNDDSVSVSYFGGVLASSRTESGRDDRGARIARIIDTMSSYELRCHYLIYSTIKLLFASSGFDFTRPHRGRMFVYFPAEHFVNAMDFSENELTEFDSIVRHSFFTLAHDSLIHEKFQYGRVRIPNASGIIIDGDGIICGPSALGAELFLWAFGQGSHSLIDIFSDDFHPKIEGLPDSIRGALPWGKPVD